MKLNGDGSGTIITGAQECGTGAVMGLPILAAEVLGMRPEDFSILYQDTDAGPWDGGASGSQTTFNNGRAVIDAATDVREQLLDLAEEAAGGCRRDDLELVDGAVRVKGSPTKSVTIAELAGDGARRQAPDRQGLGHAAAEPPEMRRVGLRRPAGHRSRALAPTFITHVARVRVDAETGVVRVLDVRGLHDCRPRPEPDRRRGPGRRRCGHGHRHGALEGTQITRRRPPDQPAPARLQARRRRPTRRRSSQRFVDAVDPDGGPHGGKGIGEPPCVPTPGAIANAIAQVDRRAGAAPAR